MSVSTRTEHASDPAGARVLPRWDWWCAIGTATTVVAVALQVGQGPGPARVPAAAAGVGLLLVGAACLVVFGDRARREVEGARPAWRWLTVAAVSMSAGQGLLFLISAIVPSFSQGWALILPWVLALPAYVAGVALLPAPLSQTTRERLLVLFDTVVAALALVLAYAVVVAPSSATGGAGWPERVIDESHPWANLLGVVLLVYVASRSGFPGGLPWGQLSWWFVAVGCYLGGSLLVHLRLVAAAAPWPVLVAPLTAAATWAVSLAAARAADEVETVAQGRRRQQFAMVFPMLPLAAAVLAVVGSLVSTSTLSTTEQWLAVVLVGVVFAGIIVMRVMGVSSVRRAAADSAVADLNQTADASWFRTIVGATSDIVSVIDLGGLVLYQTPSAARVLGYEPGHWLARPFPDLVHPDDRASLRAALTAASRDPGRPHSTECRMRARDGVWRFAETSVTALGGHDGLHGFVLASRDVSDRRLLHDMLERQADTDPLTGLANRASLRCTLAESLIGSAPGQIAVLTLDLDDFTAVNDSLGHDDGDRLLVQVAAALQRCVRPWDLVARIGGDEFAVLVVSRGAERAVARMQERVRRALAGTITVDGRELALAASAGYAVNDSGLETADELLRNADLALARARSGHQVEILRFHREMHEALITRVTLERELRQALLAGQLYMTYQPVFAFDDGRMVGAEALVRWRHPDRGVMVAGEFMPLAEDTGLVIEIGAWALRQVARDRALVRRRVPTLGEFHMGVNISPQQLEPPLVAAMQSALADAGAPADGLLLEVTESSLVARPLEAAGVLRSVRSLGVLVALDDFGTGYSSLGLLAQYEVDVLKIDKTFVADMTASAERAALARTIVHLSAALGLRSVAEGVETAAQVELLSSMGCDFAQGFLFAEPMTIDDLIALLLHPRPPVGDRTIVLERVRGSSPGSTA